MQITLMGTGTSHGVPVIACDCQVCRSPDPHDKRMRASAYITHKEANGEYTAIIIDTGPEFRMQCLRYGVKKADAVLLTHSHADHLDGLDDVRVFSHTSSQGATTCMGKETPGLGLPVYGNANTLHDVQNRFDYIFKQTQLAGGKPKLRLVDCAQYSPSNPLWIGSVRIIPIAMMHGTVPSAGWLLSVAPRYAADGGYSGTADGSGAGEVHSFAYLTDLNYISGKSIRLITDNCGILDALVIDGLRERHHSTHFTFREALECADKIGARNTYLTHICHSTSHEQITKWCKEHIKDFANLKRITEQGGTVCPAYDGMALPLDTMREL